MGQRSNVLWVLLLSGILAFPTAVDIAHIFTGHQHNFCNQYSGSHFHQDNLDCELFSFHKTSYPSIELFNYSVFLPEIYKEKNNRDYSFLSTHQPLPFGQRGPPL